MKEIIKILIKDLFKDRQYILLSIISIVGSLILINNISSKYIDTNVSFIIIFIYFLFNVITILMPLIAVLIILPVSERVSGRSEFYLANNVNIKILIIIYSLISFITSCIPNFIFNILYILFSIINKNSIIVKLVFNIKYLILAIFFLITIFVTCYILTMLIFITKRIDILRIILTFSNVAIIYIAALPIKIITKFEVIIKKDTILLFSNVFLILVLSILIISARMIEKQVKNENIIMSFKQ